MSKVNTNSENRKGVRSGCLTVTVFVLVVGGILFGLRAWQRSLLGPLGQAAVDGDYYAVERLINGGLDANTSDGRVGRTALHAAAGWGRVPIARLLIERGAKAGACDVDGYTPLHMAARGAGKIDPPPDTQRGRNLVAGALIDGGADVNARTHGGYTPLDFAERYGNTELVELLRSHGAVGGRRD